MHPLLQGFLRMPTGLPMHLQQLDLSQNELEAVNTTELARLTDLRRLDLSRNLLSGCVHFLTLICRRLFSSIILSMLICVYGLQAGGRHGALHPRGARPLLQQHHLRPLPPPRRTHLARGAQPGAQPHHQPGTQFNISELVA